MNFPEINVPGQGQLYARLHTSLGEIVIRLEEQRRQEHGEELRRPRHRRHRLEGPQDGRAVERRPSTTASASTASSPTS